MIRPLLNLLLDTLLFRSHLSVMGRTSKICLQRVFITLKSGRKTLANDKIARCQYVLFSPSLISSLGSKAHPHPLRLQLFVSD